MVIASTARSEVDRHLLRAAIDRCPGTNNAGVAAEYERQPLPPALRMALMGDVDAKVPPSLPKPCAMPERLDSETRSALIIVALIVRV
mmetsp:Transcript_8039/g.18173  ORF Transcript_8039/g.18173 Transcript_8039/m.18173 type:complete len:88 (+) Transcript_8039:1668-1931(+)